LGAFLVLKLPRTGSSMFGRVLNGHPGILCANEFLNPYEKQRRGPKVRALASFYRDPPGEDGASLEAVGQTMNPFKYRLRPGDVAAALAPDSSGALARLTRRLGRQPPPPPLKVVVLLRENVLKQGVSAYLSKRRGNHISNRDWVKNQKVLSTQEFDIGELRATVQRLAESAANLRAFAHGLGTPTMDVTYEDLQGDPVGIFDSVFDYLEVSRPPSGFDYAAGFRKMLSDDLRDVVANFDELQREPLLARYL
jgi:LPS sulfotransferase NodH